MNNAQTNNDCCVFSADRFFVIVKVVHEEEEPLVFSFYQDMSKNPHVIKLMLQLNQAIHKVFSMMNKYLDGWRRYDTVYNLWNPKRKQALDKLAEKKHTCVYFDTRIASYELLAETVRAQPSEKDVDFIRIDCYPVALGIAAQADQWKMDYGAVLHRCSSVLLEELCTKMTQVGRGVTRTYCTPSKAASKFRRMPLPKLPFWAPFLFVPKYSICSLQ